jgi:hypothetical protein
MMSVGFVVISWRPYFLGLLGVLCAWAAWFGRRSHRFLSGALGLTGALLRLSDLFIRHMNLGK